MITDTEISLLHSCWCKLTGQDLPLRSICDSRRLAWQRFSAAGHTRMDLETVLIYLNRKIREDHWDRACTRFTNLIEDLNHLEEVLAEALAQKRNARPTQSAKEATVQQWHPTVSAPVEVCTARQVGEIMARGFEAMRQAANGERVVGGY